MEQIIINFAKHQKLPPRYKIEYWESDEHYHWVIDDNNYSEMYSSKWQARRASWAHYRDSIGEITNKKELCRQVKKNS